MSAQQPLVSDTEKAAKLSSLKLRLAGTRLPERFTNNATDTVLLRFLAARGYDVDKAYAMLNDTLEWRQANSVDSVLEANVPESSHAVLCREHRAFYCGFDRAGHPVYIEYFGATQWLKVLQAVSMDDVVRAHTQQMEVTHRVLFRAASQRAGRPIQRQVNILDMRGFTVGSLTGKALELTKAVAKIDQDNYPETLEVCYIINPPWAFAAAFSLVTRFMDEKTRKKLVVLGSGPELPAKLKAALGPAAHVPAAAVTGPSPLSGPIEGMVGAHEVVYEYIAERTRREAQHGENGPDSHSAVDGTRTFATLSNMGPAAAAVPATTNPLWHTQGPPSPLASPGGGVPPPSSFAPPLPPPALPPRRSASPAPGAGGPPVPLGRSRAPSLSFEAGANPFGSGAPSPSGTSWSLAEAASPRAAAPKSPGATDAFRAAAAAAAQTLQAQQSAYVPAPIHGRTSSNAASLADGHCGAGPPSTDGGGSAGMGDEGRDEWFDADDGLGGWGAPESHASKRLLLDGPVSFRRAAEAEEGGNLFGREKGDEPSSSASLLHGAHDGSAASSSTHPSAAQSAAYAAHSAAAAVKAGLSHFADNAAAAASVVVDGSRATRGRQLLRNVSEENFGVMGISNGGGSHAGSDYGFGDDEPPPAKCCFCIRWRRRRR